MKIFVTLITLLMSTLFAGAQESWKICLNNKLVLNSSESNEEVNIKKINSIEWLKNGTLEVTYKESPLSTWLHSLQFTDESGNQLLVKDSTMSASISITTLRKLFKGKKELKIYMIISPPDPLMLAPTRMKHLVTLRLP